MQVKLKLKQMKFVFLKVYTLRLMTYLTEQVIGPLSLLTPSSEQAGPKVESQQL